MSGYTLLFNIPLEYFKRIAEKEKVRYPKSIIHKVKGEAPFVKLPDVTVRFDKKFKENSTEKLIKYFDIDNVPLKFLNTPDIPISKRRRKRRGSRSSSNSSSEMINAPRKKRKGKQNRKTKKRVERGNVYTIFNNKNVPEPSLLADEARLVVYSDNDKYPINNRIPNLPCRAFFGQCQVRDPESRKFLPIPDDDSESYPYDIRIGLNQLEDSDHYNSDTEAYSD